MYYWDALEQSKEAVGLVEGLPTAQLMPIEIPNFDVENPSGWQASVVQGEIVGMVTKKYQLVQHSEAFMPIIKGLDATAQKYSTSVWHRKGKAGLRIITDDEAADGVKLGFQAINSVDGTTALYYNMTNFLRKRIVEVVGYRQTCSNGAVMRVPLDQAEFVRTEVRDKILVLLKKSLRIVHVGNAKEKAESVQYLVEALSLLKEPIALMIASAQNIEVSRTQAELLLEKYVGKRLMDKCKQQFVYDKENEGTSLWSLYNAITFVASHGDIADSSKKSLFDNSADMLTDVLKDGMETVLKA